MTNNLKQALYVKCLQFVEAQHDKIQNQIAELQEALTSETKSSAGDKHETGRAMLQLEREKIGKQLFEVEKLKETLFKIDVNSTSKTVVLGSVVMTSNAHYFIAISVGHLIVNGISFFAISPLTPMGRILMGKTVGDSVMFRDHRFVIEMVV